MPSAPDRPSLPGEAAAPVSAGSAEHPGVALRRSFGGNAIRLGDIVFARAEAALAPLELTPLSYDALVCIVEGHGMSQQDLSRRLGIYAPKMVAVLDGLQRQGLVERQVDPTDRRRHRLILTPEGRHRLDRATAVAVAMEASLFENVPDEAREWLAALVRRLEADGGAPPPGAR